MQETVVKSTSGKAGLELKIGQEENKCNQILAIRKNLKFKNKLFH